jgi:hypothetical protein
MFWFNRWVACSAVCLFTCLVTTGCGPSDDLAGDGNNTQASLEPNTGDPTVSDPSPAEPNQIVVAEGNGTSPGDPTDGNNGNKVDPAKPSATDNTPSSPDETPSDADANTESANPGNGNESDDPTDPQATQVADDDDEVVIPRDPITGRPLPPRELTEGNTPKQPAKKVKTLGLDKIPEAKPTGKRTHFVTFEDLIIDMKQDEKFKPQMLTQKVVDLNNQRVKIQGFIFPALPIAKGIKAFPLVKNTECKFGPGGTAHHLVDIKMAKGVTVDYTTRIVTVEGILTIKPFDGFDGNTWSIYEMKCDKAY